MSNRTDFANQAREYYQRHHMSENPHPRDVAAMETELHDAFVAGQESADRAALGPLAGGAVEWDVPAGMLATAYDHIAQLRGRLAMLGDVDAVRESMDIVPEVGEQMGRLAHRRSLVPSPAFFQVQWATEFGGGHGRSSPGPWVTTGRFGTQAEAEQDLRSRRQEWADGRIFVDPAEVDAWVKSAQARTP